MKKLLDRILSDIFYTLNTHVQQIDTLKFVKKNEILSGIDNNMTSTMFGQFRGYSKEMMFTA